MTKYLRNGTPVLTDDEHPLYADSLLLAAFADPKHDARVLDAGCGMGVILLYLADAGHSGELFGIDTDDRALELLRRAASDANITNISAGNADARTYSESRKYDIVISNPPYFAGDGSVARHDGDFTAKDLCGCAKRCLKEGGSLYVCYPASRLAYLFESMRQNSLEPKSLRFVGDKKISIALCEARYRAGEGLTVLQTLKPDSDEYKLMTGGKNE